MYNDAIEYVPQNRLPLVIDDAAVTQKWASDAAATQVMPALGWWQDVRRRLNTCGLRSYRANIIATGVMLAGMVAAALIENGL